MSEFAFFRFKSNNLLTLEEEAHKQEIISVTEEVLDAKGMECDARMAKISEEQLREILAEVRSCEGKEKGFPKIPTAQVKERKRKSRWRSRFHISSRCKW